MGDESCKVSIKGGEEPGEESGLEKFSLCCISYPRGILEPTDEVRRSAQLHGTGPRVLVQGPLRSRACPSTPLVFLVPVCLGKNYEQLECLLY